MASAERLDRATALKRIEAILEALSQIDREIILNRLAMDKAKPAERSRLMYGDRGAAVTLIIRKLRERAVWGSKEIIDAVHAADPSIPSAAIYNAISYLAFNRCLVKISYGKYRVDRLLLAHAVEPR